MDGVEREFALNRAVFRNVKTFENYLDAMWEDPDFTAKLVAAGIDPNSLPSRRKTALNVSSAAAALDPETVKIIVAFAPAAATITLQAWQLVVVPWLERRKGVGTLTESNERKTKKKRTSKKKNRE